MGYIKLFCMLFVVTFVCLYFGLPGIIQEANARSTTHYNILIIQYSETCNREMQYTNSSSCPPLQELIPFDTSNKHISGTFVDINGTWFRTKPQAINHYEFYDSYNKTVVCVVCTYPGGLA